MELTKANCKKIKLKNRKYRLSKKLQDLGQREEYIVEFDTFDDVQIIRYFHALKDYCIEVERIYIKSNGQYLLMSYGSNYFYGNYKLNLNTNFDFRNIRHVVYYGHRTYYKSILPRYKKYFKSNISSKLDVLWYSQFVYAYHDNTNFESLASINIDLFIKLYLNYCSNQEIVEYIDNYIRCFQLITKWNYKITDVKMYIDHLELVKNLNLDLRSPKYIAPKDLYDAHSKLSDKANEKQITKEAELEYIKKVKRYKLNTFIINNSIYSIMPLTTVKQVYEEGKKMHHCVFSNKYYEKPNVLLFTSYLNSNNSKLETIEFDLNSMKVVQSRGKYNELTQHHDEIVKLAETGIRNYLPSTI